MKELVRRPKRFTFVVPTCELNDGREFIIVKKDYKQRRIRDLCHWDDGLDVPFILFLKDSLTGNRQRHTLYKVIKMEKHLILIWNPRDAMDNLMAIMPSMIVTSMVAGTMAMMARRAESKNTAEEGADVLSGSEVSEADEGKEVLTGAEA